MVREALRGAAEAGHETQLFEIATDLHGCTGCHACKNDGDGMCVQRDALTPYFEALPTADAVILGAGIYMDFPQAEAWAFMNRHFCVNRGIRAGCRIPAGIRLLPMFAQGAPDAARYAANFEAFLAPFDNWGFDRRPVLLSTGPLSDDTLKKAFAAGRGVE
jgi:multimeric flavodoxin WrbA